MKTITKEIFLSRKLIDQIKHKATQEKITFPEMIRVLYQVEPNNCLLFYFENGKYFKNENYKKTEVEAKEFELYKIINTESKILLVRKASLGPINLRK
jgi:hypothetical protein